MVKRDPKIEPDDRPMLDELKADIAEMKAHIAAKPMRLAAMTPEKRALFESIIALREKIGRVDIDVVAELRKMRGSEDHDHTCHRCGSSVPDVMRHQATCKA